MSSLELGTGRCCCFARILADFVPSEDVDFIAIVLCHIDGHEQLPAFLGREWSQAV